MNSIEILTQQNLFDILVLYHFKKVKLISLSMAYNVDILELQNLINEHSKQKIFYAETKTNTYYIYDPEK